MAPPATAPKKPAITESPNAPQSSKFPRALRLVRTIMGFTVVLLGLVLAIPGVPGPGFVFIIAGLAILATEYAWARRYLGHIKAGGEKLGSIFFRRKEKPPKADS